MARQGTPFRFATCHCYKCGRFMTYVPPFNRYRAVGMENEPNCIGPLCPSCVNRHNSPIRRDPMLFPINGMPYIDANTVLWPNELYQGSELEFKSGVEVPVGTIRGPMFIIRKYAET